jgi:hypothetical protein
MLRDKFPNTLEEAQDWAGKIKENMLSSKVDPMSSSRTSTSRAEMKLGTVHTADPVQDPIRALNPWTLRNPII